jgi:hypothetical protein
MERLYSHNIVTLYILNTTLLDYKTARQLFELIGYTFNTIVPNGKQ